MESLLSPGLSAVVFPVSFLSDGGGSPPQSQAELSLGRAYENFSGLGLHHGLLPPALLISGCSLVYVLTTAAVPHTCLL